MAVVNLCGLWLNDYDDPSDFITLDWGDAMSRVKTVPGSIITTASGRLILRTSTGVANQWTVSATNCDPYQMTWMDAHTGVPVWVRDWLGHRILGVYLQTPTAQHLYDVNGDVTLTMNEVTPESA